MESWTQSTWQAPVLRGRLVAGIMVPSVGSCDETRLQLIIFKIIFISSVLYLGYKNRLHWLFGTTSWRLTLWTMYMGANVRNWRTNRSQVLAQILWILSSWTILNKQIKTNVNSQQCWHPEKEKRWLIYTSSYWSLWTQNRKMPCGGFWFLFEYDVLNWTSIYLVTLIKVFILTIRKQR